MNSWNLNAFDNSPLFKITVETLLSSTNMKAKIFMPTRVTQVLQIGPTCGFAALATSLRILDANDDIDLQKLVELAIKDHITNKGELFSVDWLAQFVNKHWPHQFKAVVAQLSENPRTIIDYFISSNTTTNKPACILVAYDCDKNFEPSTQNGHCAHWAALVGFLLLTNDSVNETEEREIIANEYFVENFNPKMNLDFVDDEKRFYIIAYQGKSRHPTLWPYPLLRDSNVQLNVPNPAGSANFRMPVEGMAAIRGKCIVLTAVDNDEKEGHNNY